MILCLLASGSLLAQPAQAPSEELSSTLYSMSGNYLDTDSAVFVKWNDVPCNVIWDGDSVVWLDNLFPNISFPDGSTVWIKGKVVNQVRVQIEPQVVYRMSMDMGGMMMEHEYSIGCLEGTLDNPTGYTTIWLVNNPKDHRLEQIYKDNVFVMYDNEGTILSAAKNVIIDELGDAVVRVPEGIEQQAFLMHYSEQATGLMKTSICHIAIQNNKAWVQGLCRSIPEAWIEGTIGDFGSISFEFGQLLGAYGHEAILYFVGVRKAEGAISKVALAYQAETGGYVMSPEYMVAETTLGLIAYGAYGDIEMLPWDGTMAQPQAPFNLQVGGSYEDYPLIAFQYDNKAADGSWIVTDSLFYEVYVNDALYAFDPDLTGMDDAATRIPCEFQHGMTFMQYPNMGGPSLPLFLLPYKADEWQKVGIRLVYSLMGQEKTTDIVSLLNPDSAIEEIAADRDDQTAYDLMGRRTDATRRGAIVVKGKHKMIVR